MSRNMMFLSSYSLPGRETLPVAAHPSTRMKLSRVWFPSVLFLSFCTAGFSADVTPVVAGVPNFHEVDANVYRGAQPSLEGFRSLAALGVKTIVDLRGDDQLPGRAERGRGFGPPLYQCSHVRPDGADGRADREYPGDFRRCRHRARFRPLPPRKRPNRNGGGLLSDLPRPLGER